MTFVTIIGASSFCQLVQDVCQVSVEELESNAKYSVNMHVAYQLHVYYIS